MTRIGTDCLVWGALALTLHASRLVGVAPLRIAREGSKWRVSVSQTLCVYSYLVMFALHAGVLAGLAIDLSLEPDHAVRVRTPTARVAWIAELIVILSISTAGVLESPKRMKQMIEYLNIIEKIHLKSSNDRASKHAEKKRYLAAIICLVAVNLQHLADFYTFISEAVNEGRELKVVCIYACFYIEFLITVLLEMQFIFLALQVNSALKSVNDSLNDLIYIIDLQTIPNSSTSILGDINATGTIPIDMLIENMKIREKTKNEAINTKRAQEKVRRLILSFGAICDVIRQVNTSYGKVLLLLIGSFFLHLVVTPYYLVSYMLSPKGRTMSLLLQALYCILHTSYLVIAVEPGHRTDREMERTSMLVSQLLRRVSSPRDSLALELDLFYKQIALNKVSYSPLGMCTLTRPLIAAICGGVTTYLVIILQFQALDKQNW